MKRNWKLAAILGLAIALLPSPAWANAFTPAISTMLVHLFIGNVLIGYVEGILLAKWFRIPRGPTTAILVLANYASAWAGSLLLTNRLSGMANVTFENAYLWVCLFIALAFLLTLLVEYPFFWFLLRKREKAVRQSLKATFVIHCISYALLLVWYGLNSPVSLVTQLDVVAAEQLQPPEEYVLYYITTDGTQVIRSDLEGKNPEVVKDLMATERNETLLVCPNQEGQFDLAISTRRDNQVVLSDIAPAVPTAKFFNPNHCISNYVGQAPKLTDNTDWDYQTKLLGIGGITGENEKENLSFNFAFETPFLSWRVSHATHLDGDFVVFELGGDRICILQPQEQKIALITRGQSPIVVKPKL
ncbi:hypothetical protein IQ235_06965 [Oscillatoriales cyanobacterium LEGE 11467]|uniref:Uncharacterized protein n=1 Tax=Zarconia navalis LEGE 11467 TaxID=1828826 RepID=A0A928VUL6_9CYAN|nr:hypothetical protein [Zarconia navalis]MBE9040527.1 hypothetical protein [Zarconia navalis LEGE 11467]